MGPEEGTHPRQDVRDKQFQVVERSVRVKRQGDNVTPMPAKKSQSSSTSSTLGVRSRLVAVPAAPSQPVVSGADGVGMVFVEVEDLAFPLVVLSVGFFFDLFDFFFLSLMEDVSVVKRD